MGYCTFADQEVRLRVFIPGLGHVTIGREQSVGDHEAGSGNTGAELGWAAGKSNMVDAEDVAIELR